MARVSAVYILQLPFPLFGCNSCENSFSVSLKTVVVKKQGRSESGEKMFRGAFIAEKSSSKAP